MKINNQPSSISFSNFKCFGEKKQSFSKKPITLVYGPNSVGKSSVLHLLVLAEYYKNIGPKGFYGKNTNDAAKIANFAGDNLDLGGFGNFVHRKDETKKIVYEEHYYGANHTNMFLEELLGPVRILENEGAFLTEMTAEEVCERLQTYERKDDSCLILTGSKRILSNTNRHFLNPSDLSLALEMIDEDNPGILPELEIEKIPFIIKGIENGNELVEMLIRSDKQPFDALDKVIIHTLDLMDKRFFDMPVEGWLDERAAETLLYITAFQRILSIRSIDFIHELGERHVDSKLLIDGVWLVKSTENTKTSVVNTAHAIFGGSCDDPLHTGEIDVEMMNIHAAPETRTLSAISQLVDSVFPLRTFEPTKLAKKIIYEYVRSINLRTQYFGPLRYYPLREDMTLTVDSRAVEHFGDIAAEIDHEVAARDVSVATRSFILNRPRFYKLFIKSPNIIRILLAPLVPSSFRKAFYPLIKHGMRGHIIELKNVWKNSKSVLSFSGSINSEQVWLQLINSKDVQIQVNRWLSETSKLGSKYTVAVQESVKHGFFRKLFRRGPKQNRRLAFVDSRTNTEVTPREMGLGVSQFLPILVAAKALRNHRILIEQPELHLHPSAQCEVADEFIRSHHEQDNEFVIETHSEHLLLRVMKRMRQTADGTLAQDHPLAITPEDICLLYVDNNDELTYLNELELDNDGALLDPWPHGFFEEGYRERFD